MFNIVFRSWFSTSVFVGLILYKTNFAYTGLRLFMRLGLAMKKSRFLRPSEEPVKDHGMLVYSVFHDNKVHKLVFLNDLDYKDFMTRASTILEYKNRVLYGCVTDTSKEVSMDLTEYLKECVYYYEAGHSVPTWKTMMEYLLSKNTHFAKAPLTSLQIELYYDDDSTREFCLADSADSVFEMKNS